MMLVLESTTVLCTSGPLYSIQFAFIVRGGGMLSPLPPPTQATLKVAYHLVRSNNFHVGVYMPLRLSILKAHPHSPSQYKMCAFCTEVILVCPGNEAGVTSQTA